MCVCVCVCVRGIVDEGFKQKLDLMYQIEEKSFGIETLGDYSLCLELFKMSSQVGFGIV